VAHDLRAPLRHLDAFSRIVLEEFANQLPEEGQQYLRTIRRSSRIMTRLVEDLLNLARIGKHDLRIERVELGPIAHSIVRQFQTETADRTIEWRVGPLPLAECDPGLMRQVLINLISNAVKYTRDRPNAVVEVDTVDMNGALAVRIRDNGVGFDMKYADKLFGVFQRLHPSDQFEGTGVGLATVDRIVKRHGGRVWAESAAGKGASFFFSLPTMSPGATDPAEEPDEETVE
jgi:light-regulated signal transduction histidine kinase (bacteriophytochrome)